MDELEALRAETKNAAKEYVAVLHLLSESRARVEELERERDAARSELYAERLQRRRAGEKYPPLMEPLREAARRLGYALAVHGSQERDLDLVAVPWVEGAEDAETLWASLLSVADAVAGPAFVVAGRMVSERPHGRRAINIHLGHAYLDVSVMPRSEALARVKALEEALRLAIGAWDHVNWMTEAYAECKRRDMGVYMEGAEDMRKARSVLGNAGKEGGGP